MADELTLVWRHLELLHQTVAELIELERTALPGRSQTASALNTVAERLEGLRDRLQPLRAEAAGHASGEGKRQLEEIDVERLNVVEADGTARLVITNSGRAPDPVVDGQTLAGARQGGNAAGLIFYNDEGDECGGLVYGGRRKDSGYAAGGGLLFDQFRQDQVLGLLHGDEDGKRWAGLWVWDRPDTPLLERREQWEAVRRMSEGAERREAARALGPDEIHRVFVGKTEERAAAVHLYDAQRRVRLRLSVAAAGAAGIEFLDEAGRVTYRLPAADRATSGGGPAPAAESQG